MDSGEEIDHFKPQGQQMVKNAPPSTTESSANLLESGIQKGMQERTDSGTIMKTTSNTATSLLALAPVPAPLKCLKLEGRETNERSSEIISNQDLGGDCNSKESRHAPQGAVPVDSNDDSGVVSPENPPALAASSKSAPPTAHKPMTFGTLGQKYLAELEYMLKEFQKLEKQLLGAKTINSVESAGSRERREKLHSFILHLQDTVDQVHKGIRTESGQSESHDSSKVSVVQEKDIDEESILKLEEHILANLLPVKVRLKKQLAAQQGAVHNPTNMPVRGVVNSDTSEPLKGSFLKEDKSQFGKPLAGGGSTLTQKLHGQTLGSASRIHGHGVGSTKSTEEKPKILFAGMALGSEQMESSVSAASTAHQLILRESSVLAKTKTPAPETNLLREAPVTSQTKVESTPEQVASAAALGPVNSVQSSEERRLIRKKRRKRKLLREQASIREAQAQAQQPKRKKTSIGKSRGPRTVEYMCAHCNEVYNSTCEYNPWWALSQHDCPKCRKAQIPRIDISAPANVIEYHPALLAHAEENGGVHTAAASQIPPSSLKASFPVPTATGSNDASDSDGLESDLSDDDGILSDLDSVDSEDSDAMEGMSPSEQAERENFGSEYTGPTLSDSESARLLILMQHASTCPCRHKKSAHRDVCRSTKWMMMHVRDCPGTTTSFDVCPFPWCRKVKHLMYHLVSCTNPKACSVCSPSVGPSLARLCGLNNHRFDVCCRPKTKLAIQQHGTKLSSAAGSMPPPSCQLPEQKHVLSISDTNPLPAKQRVMPCVTSSSQAITSEEAAATAHAVAAAAETRDILVTSMDRSATGDVAVATTGGDGKTSMPYEISSDSAKLVAAATEEDTGVDAETWSVVAGLQDALEETKSPGQKNALATNCTEEGLEDSNVLKASAVALEERVVSVADKAVHLPIILEGQLSETSTSKVSMSKSMHEDICEVASSNAGSLDIATEGDEKGPVSSEGASEAVCVQ